jgi:hypothetical protein
MFARNNPASERANPRSAKPKFAEETRINEEDTEPEIQGRYRPA